MKAMSEPKAMGKTWLSLAWPLGAGSPLSTGRMNTRAAASTFGIDLYREAQINLTILPKLQFLEVH
jgi:hypothetical protein